MFSLVHPLWLLAAIFLVCDLAAATAIESLVPLAVRNLPRPRFGSVPYGVYITRCNAKGKVALTFDDGPGEYTEKILNTLEQNGNIKATFFLVGTNGKYGISNPAYTAVLKRMLNAGHQLGSHSWSHQNFNTIPRQQQIEEIVKNEEIFAKTLGIIPTYWRPPYTHCDAACISILNDYAYHITDLSLDTEDWLDNGVNAKQIYSSAIKSSNPLVDSFICLAHDIHPFAADGFVQYMIDVAKEKGYEFTTVGDCLEDSPSNWYRDPKTGEPWGGSGEEPNLNAASKSEPPSKSIATTTASTGGASTISGTDLQALQTKDSNPTTSTSIKSDGPTPVKASAASATHESAILSLGPVNAAVTNGASPSTSTSTTTNNNAAGRLASPYHCLFISLLAYVLVQ